MSRMSFASPRRTAPNRTSAALAAPKRIAGPQPGNQVLQQQIVRGSAAAPRLQLQRAAPIRVALTTTGNCADPRAIATAIPGARSMLWTAVTWMLSFNPGNRATVGRLLRANFLSDAEEVRDEVKNRLVAAHAVLADAQAGSLTFDCPPATDPECASPAYVRVGERGVIHICPAFFGQTLEGRRWTLIHEAAHLAGALRSPESYYGLFGPVGSAECLGNPISGTTSEALGTADNYARFVWCLTRARGITVTPATATP